MVLPQVDPIKLTVKCTDRMDLAPSIEQQHMAPKHAGLVSEKLSNLMLQSIALQNLSKRDDRTSLSL